jgi:uncharacterized protein YkwD
VLDLIPVPFRTRAAIAKIATVAFAVGASACSAAMAGPENQVPPGVHAALLSTPSSEACPAEDADTAGARASIARIRAMAGLPALRCDASAMAAATRHCEYVVANNELTHQEIPGRPAFFAASFDQRLAKENFGEQPNAEVISSLTGAAALDDWRGLVNSVYHRAPFLRTENTSFGYGHSGACATIDFGHAADKAAPMTVVVWPPTGATNVPPAFRADHETPNPLPGSTTIGSPVSLLGGDPSLTFGAQMTGPAGRVDVVLRIADGDPGHLVRAGEVHVLPRAPLAENAQYTVHFVGVLPDGTTALDVSTTFTTGGQ